MEEHFRNKLKNHKVDWDKEVLLEDLKQQLSQDKKDSEWKWLLLLFFFLIGVCVIWNYTQPLKDHKVTEMSVADDPKEDNKRIELDNSGQTVEKEIETSSAKKEVEAKTLPSTAKEAITPTEIKIKQPVNTSHHYRTSEPSTGKDNLSLANFSTTKSSVSDAKVGKASLPFVSSSLKSPDNIIASQSLIEPTRPLSAELTRANTILSMDLIPTLGLKVPNSENDKEVFPSPKMEDILPEEIIVNTPNPFYISGSAGLGVVFRNRKFDLRESEIDIESDFLERLEANEKTERTLFILTANLDLGYQHVSGFSLQSGLEYTEINEVFNHKELKEQEIVPKEKVRYFVVTTTDTLYVLDTVDVLQNEERVVKHFNKHRFYTVPIELGYAFELDKAKLVTRLGMSYTFSHNYEGRMNYLFQDGGSLIIENSPEFSVELKNRLGLKLGLGLEYPILKQSHFFVNATYRRSPNMSFGRHEQVYHSVALGAGVRFSIGS